MSRKPTLRSSFQPALGVALSLGMLAALAACGGAKPEAGGGAAASGERAASAAAPAAAAIDIASCAGFGIEDAARILGIAASELEAQKAQESWGTTCSFAPKGQAMSASSVSFTLSRSDSVDEAAGEMAQLADHASVSDQVLPGQTVTHWVEGVGDQALRVAANDSLYVRAGDVTIIVTMPEEETKQVEVARRLVG